MEKLRFQISPVEAMSIMIPDNFTAISFKEFYNQIILIGKSMPSLDSKLSNKGRPSSVPEKFMSSKWSDEEESVMLIRKYAEEGKQAVIDWFSDQDMELDDLELRYLTLFLANLKSKFKKVI